MNSKLPKNKLNIGAFYLRPYARTEKHVKEVKDCGIDFILWEEENQEMLDLFYKYGIGLISVKTMPFWGGGDGKNAGKYNELNPISLYVEKAKEIKEHPAVIGRSVVDEPSALDYKHIGDLVNFYKKAFPDKIPYVNLYPNYAQVAVNTSSQVNSQLGTVTYQEYIDEYCKNVPTDYISYDFYVYATEVSDMYKNLITVSDACRKTGRDFWIILQVNSLYPEKWITENQLRFQAFTALAFGAVNISWACYCKGWWTNQVLDDNGNKTEQYEKLKKVNAELHAFGKAYMKYRNVATYFIGKENQYGNIPSLSTAFIFDLHAQNGEQLVVGDMVSRKEDFKRAVMIATADDPQDTDNKTFTISFKANENTKISVQDQNGALPFIRKDNCYEFTAHSNQAILIELSDNM